MTNSQGPMAIERVGQIKGKEWPWAQGQGWTVLGLVTQAQPAHTLPIPSQWPSIQLKVGQFFTLQKIPVPTEASHCSKLPVLYDQKEAQSDPIPWRKVKNIQVRDQWDGSVSKDTWCQARPYEFDPQDPYGGRRKLIPQVTLWSLYMPPCTHKQMKYNENIF